MSRYRPVQRTSFPSNAMNSPRSHITPYSSKKSVPSLPHYPNVLEEQAHDNSDLLIISPIPLNRMHSRSPRAAPVIYRPKIEQSYSIIAKNQKKEKEKSTEKIMKRFSKGTLIQQKYSTGIQEIESLLQKLIAKHPENEDYYRKHFAAFMRIVNEASNTNPAKVSIIIQNTKMFFEGLLNGQIGRRGKIEIPNFNFETKLRTILTNSNNHGSSNPNSGRPNSSRSNHSNQANSNDNNVNENNIFQDLFDEYKEINKRENENDLSKSNKSNTSDLLKGYEKEIQEVHNLMQKLIDKHPENEDYYRKHYEDFLRVLNEAAETNPSKIPTIINNTKTFLEGLLNGQIGTNGRFEKTNFNFEQQLRSILDNDNEDENNIFKDIINDNESSKSKSKNLSNSSNVNNNNDDGKNDHSILKDYENEIQEVHNIMQKLIDKYPENEDYYHKHYEDFLRVLNEAAETNPSKIPTIINNTKTFLEGLLNGQIGTNGRFEKTNFNFEQQLRSILDNNNEDENNIFKDIINDNENNNSKLKAYEKEIQEIHNLMQQLIDKYPENEDYYRKHYETFLRVLSDAVEENNERAPMIIQSTRNFFEGLLNGNIGKDGKLEDDGFDFEKKLRNILSGDDGNDFNYTGTSRLNLPALAEDPEYDDEENDLSGLKDYELEIGEIKNIVNKLIDKHPENKDYYKKLFNSFLKVLKEAVETNNPSAPEIVKAAKTIFEELLEGDQDQLDYDFEDKLRDILNKSDENKEDEENDLSGLKDYESEIGEIKDIVNKLIDKHPENKDYYKKLFNSFLKVLKEAVETNNPSAPEIVKAAKTIFEELLEGDQDQLDYDLEDKLRDILNKSNENNEDDENSEENDLSGLKDYESEISEIKNIVNKLIDKHPENKDYYKKLFNSFLKVLKEAVETNNPSAPEIVKAAKTIFEELLEGDQDQLDYDLEDKLRDILNKSGESNESENVDDKSGTAQNDENSEENDLSGLKDYESEIGEIKDIVNKLIDKHPENKDYYKKLFNSFLKVLKEAVETNNPSAPEIVKAAKTIFEELLEGDQDQLDYDLEDKLRDILNKSNEENDQSNPKSEMDEIQDLLNRLIEKYPENEDFYRKLYEAFLGVVNEAKEANSPSVPGIIHVTKLFFEELLNGDHAKIDFNIEDKLREMFSMANGDNNNDDNENSEENDLSGLKDYESEIGEIKDIMNKLIDKHPENTDYYKKLFNSFLKVLKEAVETNNPSAPEIVKAAKTIFEELLEGDQDQLDYDFEDKLRDILNKSNEENDQSNPKSEMDEIQDLLNRLIEKYPENEDFYRKLYEAFMGVVKEAQEANSPSVPGITHVTKLFFEELLNGDHAKIDFNIEDKLREILSTVNDGSNDDQNDENSEENDLSGLKDYESEIGEIKNIMQNLIDKHPENTDYYKKLFDSFLKVLKEAVETNNPSAPEIVKAAKTIFEELLEGDQDQLDYDFEDKLRDILNKSNEENDQSNGDKYESEIGEIQNIVQDLINKHPENEDYYRKLYEAFLKVIKEASESNSPAAAEIIKATKTIFEELLGGDKDQLDYDLEDKLRGILNKSNEENDQSNSVNYDSEIGEIHNIVQDLINKHPENEDYYRKLYEAFLKVINEARESNSPAADEILRAAKKIFADLLEGDKDQLDYDLEDKLRDILNKAKEEADSIYKPYNEINNEDDDDTVSSFSQKVRPPNFEKLYPAPRQTATMKRSSTVPNYQTIINALRFTSLPGPRFTKLVDSLIEKMKENKEERFVLLMASRTQKFKGLYILSEDALSAQKLWGEGPKEVKNEDCCAYYKYLNGQKMFDPLQINGFTQTTDGFSLKRKLESDTW